MTNLNKANIRKTGTLSLIAAIVVGVTSLPATAGNHRANSGYNDASFDYARVIKVDPIFETYQVNQPVEHCWNEKVPARQTAYHGNKRHHNSSKTPVILGAIIGGVIGNQIGKNGGGRSRDVATVAGAVLGGSIGNDTRRRNTHSDRHHDRYQTTHYESVQRCEIKDSYVSKRELVGYDVAYKYRGEVFHTQTGEHPGDKIKVKVSVNPV